MLTTNPKLERLEAPELIRAFGLNLLPLPRDVEGAAMPSRYKIPRVLILIYALYE